MKRVLFQAMVGLALLACTDSTAPTFLPVLLNADPGTIALGSPAATVTLHGSNFTPDSRVHFGVAERETNFIDERTLSVHLDSAELAAYVTWSVTVVNPSPGGGTSGAIDLTVANLVPTIAALTPASVVMPPLGATGLTSLTIDGDGFVKGSAVLIRKVYYLPVSVAPHRITLNVDRYALDTAGPVPIRVLAPSPGGGPSAAATLLVQYPVPTITGFAPDSALTDKPFTLTVNGTNFTRSTTVTWNGVARAATPVSGTQLTVPIPASDLAASGSATVAVTNGQPGGGTASRSLMVWDPTPFIISYYPQQAYVGTPTAIAISGQYFRPGATVRWNGVLRNATVFSDKYIRVELDSADVAVQGQGQLTIQNPGPRGLAPAMVIGVVPPPPTAAIQHTIMLENRDVAADDVHGALYASVAASATSYTHSVVRIDPVSGTITGAVDIGGDGGTMALSDDGQFLYVARLDAPVIVRIALASFTRDVDILIPADSVLGTRLAADLQPLRGAPHAIVVSTRAGDANGGTFVFDDAVPRGAPLLTPGAPLQLTGGTADDLLFAHDAGRQTSERMLVLQIDATGAHARDSIAVILGTGADVEYDSGRVFTSNGEVRDAATMATLGHYMYGPVRPDVANNRIAVSDGTSMVFYDATTLEYLRAAQGATYLAKRVVRWGHNGLATGNGSAIQIISGSLIAP